MLKFIFDGKDSYRDYGILISKRPSISSPARRISYIDIPGRHSRLRYDEEAFDDITILVECAVQKKELLSGKLDDIKAWLFGVGESNLIFSFQPEKRYIAQVVNAIAFEQICKDASKFPIVFNCRPFKYAVQNSPLTITESGSFIINPGTIESEPVISVYGSGNIELTLGSNIISLIGVTNKIIINTVIQDAYDDEGLSLNSKMNGEFPHLGVGHNEIKWTGDVQKIEILPNWRWI